MSAPTNDEREQTLNQLLVEMDGFEPNSGVIILAATNRPEVLDRALLRPGRFDRQVIVDAPDMDGREAILQVHARNKPLAADVKLRKIAQATPGFSGADLANAMNEAAWLAARRKATRSPSVISKRPWRRSWPGPERKSRRLEEEERRRVAFHEVGHALVAAYSRTPIRSTRSASCRAAGRRWATRCNCPPIEQFLMTRSEIIDRIKGLLGGRAAEEVAFDEVTHRRGERSGAGDRHGAADGLPVRHEPFGRPGSLRQTARGIHADA